MFHRHRPERAFTLIELLVVVGIIALLIGILLPSLQGARISARNLRVKAQLDAIREALESFKNDVGDYPESAKRLDPTEDSSLPGPAGVNLYDSTLYGGQALARALVGKDFKGYVSRKRARDYNRDQGPPWYYDNRDADYVSGFPRETVYFNEKHDFVRTRTVNEEEALGGRPPASVTSGAYSDPNRWTNLVIIDAFDRPILYYKANPRGNLIADATVDGGTGPAAFPADYPNPGPYSDCVGQQVIPYYNLLDNDIFTGSQAEALGVSTSEEGGWKFGPDLHEIRELGDPCAPDDPAGIPAGFKTTFAKYIHDHKLEQAAGGALKPVNPDSYLLISAGVDGVYGTEKDINNFQER